MNKTWDSLLEFETRDLIEFYYKQRHHRDPNANKIKEISSNFSQAREYFKNYQMASLTVKPLILYYGILSLSRGLVLFLTPDSSESSLKPSHGLEVTNWQKAFKDKEYLDLEIKIQNGAFLQLLEATENKTYFYNNSSMVNWQVTYDLPSAESKITLLDLLQCYPDLHHQFQMASGKKLEYIKFNSIKVIDENNFNIEMTFERPLTSYERNVFYNDRPEDQRPEAIIEEQTINSNKIPFITQKWDGPFDIGDAMLIKQLPNDIKINDLGKNLMLSYVLGMLARYFPTTWGSIGKTEKGDKVYPLIVATLKHLETTFPIQTLDFLKGPYKFE